MNVGLCVLVQSECNNIIRNISMTVFFFLLFSIVHIAYAYGAPFIFVFDATNALDLV